VVDNGELAQLLVRLFCTLFDPGHREDFRSRAAAVRAGGASAFQINLWVPDPAPARDAANEAALRRFLAQWSPAAADSAPPARPDFAAQCEALLAAAPPVVSSIMGVYSPAFVGRLRARGIAWFANATTVQEARLAAAAGADAIVAQGMEAGGHRGAFEAAHAERELVGLCALVPAIVDAVRVPVIATGGIADGRGVAAALALGASAVQIGTGFLRTPEAGIASSWAAALARTPPERTVVSRVFSGRPGRSIVTAYVRAATAPEAPAPAPYPVQAELVAPMRAAAAHADDVDRMAAWAGQSAGLARAEPASDLVARLWDEGRALLR